MEEFVIPLEQRDVLLSTSSRICKLFNVQVLVQNESENCQWVKICSVVQGKTADLKTAKDYITAVCCPDITEIIPYSCRSVINIDDIAKNYGVLAEVLDTENIISLKGIQINVALAKSLLENEGPSYDAMESCKSFARKLGYSNDDIEVVARSLWPGPVDNNTFLEEMIRRNQSQRLHRRDIVPRGIASRSKPVSYVDRTNQQQQQKHQIIEVPRYLDEHIQADGGCHGNLCPIIIDGSNVAMYHGNHKVFSCRGIALCVEWFHKRGHKEVYALVPRYRADQPPYPGCVIEDQDLLLDMAEKGVVIFTPSKHVKDGKDIVCYDDRFILDLAYKLDGVVVSNDGYRDLVHENSYWKYIIEKRVLMFSFVKDLFMVPDDPLGRTGPTLTNFLRKGTNIQHAKICPWIGNCTFGSRCRFYHPEKERKAEHSKRNVSNVGYILSGNEQGEQLQLQQQPQRQPQQPQHQQHSQQVGGEPDYQHQHHNQPYQPQRHQLQPQRHQQQHRRNPLYPAAQQNQYIRHEQYRHPSAYHHQSWQYEDIYTQHTMYSCTTPRHYSYTPPNSFGYNNSGSIIENDTALYDKLIEMFPGEEERITALLKEKLEIKDIAILVDGLLQDQS